MKFEYRLITRGYKTTFRVADKIVPLVDEKGNTKKMDALHYSKVKYVMAKNEELARQMIRDKHHLNKFDKDGKWSGFIILKLGGKK